MGKREKFLGTLDELQRWVEACGAGGDWRKIANGYQMRCEDGAILNWFSRRGTLQYQGLAAAAVKLRAAIDGGPEPVLTQLELALEPEQETLFDGSQADIRRIQPARAVALRSPHLNTRTAS